MRRLTLDKRRRFATAVLPLLLALAMAATSQAGEGTSAAESPDSGSVPERFRIHTGQRTLEELVALFTRTPGGDVRQSPAIAISDGRSAVIIAARIAARHGSTTNFSLAGATMVSLKKIKSDEWQIKAIPEQGTVAMALIVLHGTETTTYPLVVAPPLPQAFAPDDQGFREYLEKSGSADNKTMDLNGDGRRDYLDDYIYTANYLAKQQTSGRDRTARKQRALQRTLVVTPEPQKPEFDPNDFPD